MEASLERFRRGFAGRRESAQRRRFVKLLMGKHSRSTIAQLLEITPEAVRLIELELELGNPTDVKPAALHWLLQPTR